MKTKNWILTAGSIVLVMFVILAMRPVPTPEEKDCAVVTGKVIKISEAGTKDVFIQLAGSDKSFYINRGLERGLDLQTLRADLLNQEITIKYPGYWTPLDPSGSIRHVSVVELNGRKIFSELQ